MSSYSVWREGGKLSTCYTVGLGHYVFRVYVKVRDTDSSVHLSCYLGDPYAADLHVICPTVIPVNAVNMAVQAFLDREKREYADKMDNLIAEMLAEDPLSFHFTRKGSYEETTFTCIRGIGKIKKGHKVVVKPGLTKTDSFVTDKYHFPWDADGVDPWIILTRYVTDRM